MSYIVNTVEEFFGKLDKMQKELSNFSQSLEGRSEKIPALMQKFENAVFSLEGKLDRASGNNVDKALMKAFEHIKNQIEATRNKIESERKGREFIKKNEKYLVVMIFGAVKAGKSSLGNSFAGKNFISAPFDNPYKHIEKPVFETEEKGRNTGDVSKDEDGQTWFTEGVVDTTGAIQYFTLSGLRWVDSPGTGAVKKEGDTKNMTELVEEYLSYTDMCIFLMNSSEPGLQEDMKYMEKLNKDGQDALIVITKSDFKEEDVDDNGKIIQVTMPKTPENRKLQEDSICERVKEQYPNIDANRFRAISVSTILASEGIKKNDEDKYRGSNLDKLMKLLGDKVEEGVIERKQENPRRQLNTFVDDTVQELDKLNEMFGETKKSAEDYKNKISLRNDAIVTKVKRRLKDQIMSAALAWNSKVKRGEKVDGALIDRSVTDILQEALEREIKSELMQIIQDYESQELPKFNVGLNATALQKKTVTVTHTFTESYTTTRPPEGFWENVCDLFGKKYYTHGQTTRTEEQTVDAGTNINEFLKDIMPKAEKFAKQKANESLLYIRDNYFVKQEALADKAQAEIAKLKKELQYLKF